MRSLRAPHFTNLASSVNSAAADSSARLIDACTANLAHVVASMFAPSFGESCAALVYAPMAIFSEFSH
jgi:hypothetical protein